MKEQRKYLFIAALFSLLIACEKDVDNTVPGNPKERIETHRQDFNRVLTSNSIENNGKIWLSGPFIMAEKDFIFPFDDLPFFIGINPKKNNQLDIYVTVGSQDENMQDTESLDEFGLLNNPNQYNIKGTFKLSFSISRQSVLSSLREKEIFDFDFDVYRYNQDSIHLKAIYEIKNKDIIFRSYDFNDNVKAFFGTCQNLFSKSFRHFSYNFGLILSDSYFSSSSYSSVSISNSSDKSSIYKGFVSFLVHIMHPYYDKNEKLFKFKIADLKSVMALYQFSITNPPRTYRLFNYYQQSFENNANALLTELQKLKIDYLIPVSATENKMVLSGVGKKLDKGKATEEDETYTITFEKL